MVDFIIMSSLTYSHDVRKAEEMKDAKSHVHSSGQTKSSNQHTHRLIQAASETSRVCFETCRTMTKRDSATGRALDVSTVM